VVKRKLAIFISVALIPLVAAPTYAASSKVKIGIVYDVGGRGDKSYDDAAAIGVDAAKKKFGLSDFDVRELVTSGSDFDRENRIEFLVKAKYDLVIGIGPNFATAMTFMADKYPESQFAIVGSSDVESINVSSMAFSASESAFLAGVLAATNTKSRKVGFFGDTSNTFNDLALRNFRAGVKYVSAKVEVFPRNPSVTAEADVSAISGAGVDVLFDVWSRNGKVVNAISKLATNSGKRKKTIKLIGLRPDQYFLATKGAQKVLIGYVNQRYDNAVIDLFKAAVAGNTITEEVSVKNGVFGRNFNLSNRGIDLVATTANQASKGVLARAKAAILAKKIKVVK